MNQHLCEDVKSSLSFYLENSLSREDKQAITAHLESCNSCRLELEAYQRLAQGMAEFRKQTAQAEPPERLWKEARAAWDCHDARSRRRVQIRFATVGACLLLLFVGATWARLYQNPTFPTLEILRDFEQTQAEAQPEFVTADADRASRWLNTEIHADIPPIPLTLSGATLKGTGFVAGSNKKIGKLLYDTPNGKLVLYVAPAKTQFAKTSPVEWDGNTFFISNPTPKTTFVAWKYQQTGLGIVANMRQEEASRYALDARRLTREGL
jgi:anti-sigma factor RsiW